MKRQNVDPAEIDARIKKLSRKVLCDSAPSRDDLRRLSEDLKQTANHLWKIAENVDRKVKRKLRKNPKWKRDRPKVADIRAEETRLKAFIGRDKQKLDIVEKLWSSFSPRELIHLSPEEMSEKIRGCREKAVRFHEMTPPYDGYASSG